MIPARTDGKRYRLARQWSRELTYYVTHRPGDGGKDWGYTTEASEAVPMSEMWKRRFGAHCRNVGDPCSCLEVQS